MSWINSVKNELKKFVNSTIGTAGEKPLDRLIVDVKTEIGDVKDEINTVNANIDTVNANVEAAAKISGIKKIYRGFAGGVRAGSRTIPIPAGINLDKAVLSVHGGLGMDAPVQGITGVEDDCSGYNEDSAVSYPVYTGLGSQITGFTSSGITQQGTSMRYTEEINPIRTDTTSTFCSAVYWQIVEYN